MYIKLIALFLLVAVPIFSLDYKIRLDDKGNFIDAYGRTLYFHGINMVQKYYPWYNESFFDERRLQHYKEWGFNFVRLGTMWAGVVPEKAGAYNETYLEILKKIITQLDKYGMVTLLDMHQDVLTSLYGSYDGIPLWLAKSFQKPPTLLRYPFPMTEESIKKMWSNGYLTYAVSDAFQRFYKNESNSLGHWADFWKKVAEKLGNINSVIGYELINEPWAGNIYKNPLRLLPGYAAKYNLMPAYKYVVDEIRKIDNKTLIFIEPLTYGVFFKSGKSFVSVGIPRMPNNDSRRTVLSYHYYCWILQALNNSNIYPFLNRLVCDSFLLQNVYKVVKKNKARSGGGLFLTEFGPCGRHNSSRFFANIQCDSILSLADQNMQSWAYWHSVFFDFEGNRPIWATVKFLARPYARAVSGESLSMSFNVKTGIFIFCFIPNTNINASTEIFLPISVHYRNGYQIFTEPEAETLVEDNILNVYQKYSVSRQTVAVVPK